ncbi:MAG: ROK family protein [Chloroflexi bacterium]|nr:ROK family protein [Chloroflexota bacterium]
MTQYGSLLAVDLGGTRIRVARLNRALEVEARVEDWTRPERGPDDAIGRMVNMLQSVWPDGQADVAIGVAAPGPLNPHNGVLLSPPNSSGRTFRSRRNRGPGSTCRYGWATTRTPLRWRREASALGAGSITSSI